MILKIGGSANLYRAAILILLFGIALVSGASFRGGGATPSAAETPHRRLNELTMVGDEDEPAGAFPLAECQGDCDIYEDCQVC